MYAVATFFLGQKLKVKYQAFKYYKFGRNYGEWIGQKQSKPITFYGIKGRKMSRIFLGVGFFFNIDVRYVFFKIRLLFFFHSMFLIYSYVGIISRY